MTRVRSNRTYRDHIRALWPSVSRHDRSSRLHATPDRMSGMSDKREKRAWRLMAAMPIGLVVTYLALFGPACWLCEHEILAQRTAWLAYRPVLWIYSNGPRTIRNQIQRYAL